MKMWHCSGLTPLFVRSILQQVVPRAIPENQVPNRAHHPIPRSSPGKDLQRFRRRLFPPVSLASSQSRAFKPVHERRLSSMLVTERVNSLREIIASALAIGDVAQVHKLRDRLFVILRLLGRD